MFPPAVARWEQGRGAALGRTVGSRLSEVHASRVDGRRSILHPERDAIAARAEKVAEFRDKFANPFVAAARGYLDEIIRPRDTRRKLITALRNLDTKRDRNPPKKHGNIPL